MNQKVQFIPTQQTDIAFTTDHFLNGEVIATAEIIKKGKTIATMKGEVFTMDGKLAATLIHTAVIMKT